VLVLNIAGCNTYISSNPAHTAKIELRGENQYKNLRLTPQIYYAANLDLSDLLIKDSMGEVVPYFINTGFQVAYKNEESYSMTLINSYVKDDNFYFDYKLTTPQNSDTAATSIEFTTKSTNFAKEVNVYGSYDDIHWDYVQRDIIYGIDNKSKLAIEFKQPQKFTHYRMELANNLEQISFDTVNLVYSFETNEEAYYIETLEPRFSVHSSDRRTKIIIENLNNLRLCDVTIHTDSMFQRNAYAAHGINKEIYNLSFNDTSYADTTIPLYWQISQDKYYTITIADADDKPISINGITVRYYVDEVVFKGDTGEAYTLEFGNDAAKIAPAYDIERYKNEILKGAMDRVTLGEIHYATEEKIPVRNYKLAFNIVIITVALLLGSIILFKLKKK
jgi:hypothetical protein